MKAMKEDPSRRDVLKTGLKAALAAGALGATTKAEAVGDLMAKDLNPDMKEVLEKEGDVIELLGKELENAERALDNERAKILRGEMSKRVKRLQELLERQREALP